MRQVFITEAVVEVKEKQGSTSSLSAIKMSYQSEF